MKYVYIFLLFCLFLGCQTKNENDIAVNKIDIKKAKNINVSTATAQLADLPLTLKTTGIARAEKMTEVVLEKGGYITNLTESEGAYVLKGQKIIELKNDKESIALAQAKSEMLKKLTEFSVEYKNPDSAQTIVQSLLNNSSKENINSVFINKVLSGEKQKEVRLAQSGLYDAWNNYRRAQIEYDHTFYKAPFNGFR